jgi:hypothetical protein
MPQPVLLSQTASLLRHYVGGARVVGSAYSESSMLLQRGYTYWFVSDNGGEFNVEPVNNPNDMVSIPTSWFGIDLDAATMAYRVACVMRGEAYDVALRMDPDETDFLLSLS